MLTEEEITFMRHWEQERMNPKTKWQQFRSGLPFALIFVFPMLVSFLTRGWYKRMPFISDSELFILLLGLGSIVFFFSYFRMKHRQDVNDNRYKELVLKKRKYEKAI